MNSPKTEQGHTPGPWKLERGDEGTLYICSPWSSSVTPGDTDTFGSCLGAHICELHYNSGVPTPEQAQANARRIVACVNACEGIENEWLEANAGLLQGHDHALQRQRDELAQFVEGCANVFALQAFRDQSDPETLAGWVKLKEQARDLLKKCRESA